MPIKKFPLNPPNPSDDPIQFALGDETFTCLDDLPAAAIHALVSYASPVRGAVAFLRGALIANDEDRFDAALASKKLIVGEDTLLDVLKYVSEQYGSRPTRRSSSSQDGPLTTNDGSPGSSPSEASPGQ